jgi:hypothetical protein
MDLSQEKRLLRRPVAAGQANKTFSSSWKYETYDYSQQRFPPLKYFFSAGIKHVADTQIQRRCPFWVMRLSATIRALDGVRGPVLIGLNLVARTTKGVIVTFEREHPFLRALTSGLAAGGAFVVTSE